MVTAAGLWAVNVTSGDRLFRHDRLIATNILKATFAPWLDQLIAFAMLMIALVVLRAGALDRGWATAGWAAACGGTLVGFVCGRAIVRRLTFHATDGPLAADALLAAPRRRYVRSLHALGLAVLAIATVAARASLLPFSLPGYAVGAAAAHGVAGFVPGMPSFETARIGQRIGAWSRRSPTGVLAAALLLAWLAALSSWLVQDAFLVAAGVGAVVLLLALTVIDDGVVRFMALAGHGQWRTIGRLTRQAAVFTGLAVPVCAVAFGPGAGAVVLVAGASTLLLATLRVATYRLHPKRFADVLVSVLTGVFVLVAATTAPALPVLVLAVLWHLDRRTRAGTWLIA